MAAILAAIVFPQVPSGSTIFEHTHYGHMVLPEVFTAYKK